MDMAAMTLGAATLAGELGVVGRFRGDLSEEAGSRWRSHLIQASLPRHHRIGSDHPMLPTLSLHFLFFFFKFVLLSSREAMNCFEVACL